MKNSSRIAVAVAFVCFTHVSLASAYPIFLVRHGEKAVEAGKDPNLSEKGQQRARALSKVLSSVQIRTVFVTELKRTKQTAQPLLDRTKLKETVVNANASSELVKKLLEQPADAPILVVGHSNTLPEIINKLGVTDKIELGDDDYDNLFMIVKSDGKISLVNLHYGE